MNSFHPIIASEVGTLFSFAFSETKWKKNADVINEKIEHIVLNFQLLTVENFKSLTPNIQEGLLDKLLENPDSSVAPLMDYLDDEACSRLVNGGKHVDKLAQYFLQHCQGDTVSLQSKHLKQDAIAYFMQSLDPETKRGVKEIDLSNCLHLQNLDFMKGAFEALEKINLTNNYFLKNVEGLEGKPLLSEVELARCSSLESITPLHGLPIVKLDASKCTKLTTIRDTISTLSSLAFTNLSGCLGIDAEEWNGVSWPSSIENVKVSHIPQFGEEALAKITSINPGAEVDISHTSANNRPPPPNSSKPEVYIRV